MFTYLLYYIFMSYIVILLSFHVQLVAVSVVQVLSIRHTFVSKSNFYFNEPSGFLQITTGHIKHALTLNKDDHLHI